MVSDAFDAMLEESDDDEKQGIIIKQVLDEIGIDLNAQVGVIITSIVIIIS